MRQSPKRTDYARKRLASGLSQKEAAAVLVVSVSYLQKIELGLLPASRRVIAGIAALSLAKK